MRLTIHNYGISSALLTTALSKEVVASKQLYFTDLPWALCKDLVAVPYSLDARLGSALAGTEKLKTVATEVLGIRGLTGFGGMADVLSRKLISAMQRDVITNNQGKHSLQPASSSSPGDPFIPMSGDSAWDRHYKGRLPKQALQQIVRCSGALYCDPRFSSVKRADTGVSTGLIHLSRTGAVIANCIGTNSMQIVRQLKDAPNAICTRGVVGSWTRPKKITIGFGLYYNDWAGVPDAPDEPDDSMTLKSVWGKLDFCGFTPKMQASNGQFLTTAGRVWDNYADKRNASMVFSSGNAGDANAKTASAVYRQRGNKFSDVEGAATGLLIPATSFEESVTTGTATELSLTMGALAADDMAKTAILAATRCYGAICAASTGLRPVLADPKFVDGEGHLGFTGPINDGSSPALRSVLLGEGTFQQAAKLERALYFNPTLSTFSIDQRFISPSSPLFDSFGRGVFLVADSTLSQVAPGAVSPSNTKGTVSIYACNGGESAANLFAVIDSAGGDNDGITSVRAYAAEAAMVHCRPLVGNDSGFRSGEVSGMQNLFCMRQSACFQPEDAYDPETWLGSASKSGTLGSFVVDATGLPAAKGSASAHEGAVASYLTGSVFGVLHHTQTAVFEDGVEGELSDMDDGGSFFTFFVGDNK